MGDVRFIAWAGYSLSTTTGASVTVGIGSPPKLETEKPKVTPKIRIGN